MGYKLAFPGLVKYLIVPPKIPPLSVPLLAGLPHMLVSLPSWSQNDCRSTKHHVVICPIHAGKKQMGAKGFLLTKLSTFYQEGKAFLKLLTNTTFIGQDWVTGSSINYSPWLASTQLKWSSAYQGRRETSSGEAAITGVS